MEVDKEIESRILMEYDQLGRFSSGDQIEVAQVVGLVGKGYVDADILIDCSAGKYSATIVRMLEDGRKFLAELRSGGSGHSDFEEWYKRFLAEIQVQSDFKHDDALLKLSSGGIALGFAVSQFIGPKSLVGIYFWLWVGSLSLWTTCVVGLVFSHVTSRLAFKRESEGCPSKYQKVTVALNRINRVTFLFGTISFVVFTCLKGGLK